jgi:catechol 2,3-dioxygenase-like lactoylglutathione lyase family enzyme
MTEVTGIDHLYVAVSDLSRSEAFYDRVMLQAL